jgi:hypothetical protein
MESDDPDPRGPSRPPTWSSAGSGPTVRTCFGWRTSPTCAPVRAGCISPRAGRLLASDRGLVDDHPHARHPGPRRAADGARAPAPRAGADPPLRPRQPIRVVAFGAPPATPGSRSRWAAAETRITNDPTRDPNLVGCGPEKGVRSLQGRYRPLCSILSRGPRRGGPAFR